MERLTEKLKRYIDAYQKPPFGREIEGTVELLQEVAGRLKEYEDLEEQGLLLKLPCKVGNTVYFIPSKVSYDLNILNGHEENNRVYHQKVVTIVFTERGWYLECDKDLECGTGHIFLDKFYQETWFLSYDEAEDALKGMEGENETD